MTGSRGQRIVFQREGLVLAGVPSMRPEHCRMSLDSGSGGLLMPLLSRNEHDEDGPTLEFTVAQHNAAGKNLAIRIGVLPGTSNSSGQRFPGIVLAGFYACSAEIGSLVGLYGIVCLSITLAKPSSWILILRWFDPCRPMWLCHIKSSNRAVKVTRHDPGGTPNRLSGRGPIHVSDVAMSCRSTPVSHSGHSREVHRRGANKTLRYRLPHQLLKILRIDA